MAVFSLNPLDPTSGADGLLTQEQITAQQKVAQAMLERARKSRPMTHWTQALAQGMEGAMAGLALRDAANASQKNAQFDAGVANRIASGAGASPAPAVAGAAQPGSGNPQSALDIIQKYESGGRNVHQNVVPAGGGYNPSTGTVTGPSSAQGYFQMITPTWQKAAKMAGIDTSQYPTAMTAPYDLQRKAASALFEKEGFSPWAPYNAALRSHIAKNGGAGAFINDGATTAQADRPAPGASPVEMSTGQDGFAVPPAQDSAPAMTGGTFNAITAGLDSQPLAPTFQAEGVSQPWMGTALPQQAAPAPAAVAQAAPPMPPPRPADLALNPQADLPAPGAVPAIGQMPQPVVNPADPTKDNAGALSGLVYSEEARKGLPSGAGVTSPFAGIVQALSGGGAPATPPAASVGTPVERVAAALPPSQPAPASPSVASVAAALPPQSSAGAPATPAHQTVATAMSNPPAAIPGMTPDIRTAITSPYVSKGTRELAMLALKQAQENAAYNRPDEAAKRQNEIKLQEKTLGKSDAPNSVQEFEYGQKTPGYTEWLKEKQRSGATNVNVGGGSDKQFFDTVKESADAARTAATGLNALREARRAVEAGGYFGAGADTKLGFAKIAQTLGLGDPSKIVNTETFRSAIAPQVAAIMKATVGSTQISNSDREFAEKAAGGSITLDEKSITRLLDIMERGSVAAIQRHQGILDQVYPDGPEGKFGRERAVFGVPMPVAPPPPANGQTNAGGFKEGQRASNGKQTLIFRNGQWVPE